MIQAPKISEFEKLIERNPNVDKDLLRRAMSEEEALSNAMPAGADLKMVGFRLKLPYAAEGAVASATNVDLFDELPVSPEE